MCKIWSINVYAYVYVVISNILSDDAKKKKYVFKLFLMRYEKLIDEKNGTECNKVVFI